MEGKNIDESPFLSKVENFEISDKNNKKSKIETKDRYTNLDNEFKFEEEKIENEEQYNDNINEKNDNKKKMNIRTIKIDRKNLKKMFSSHFFTQTATDGSSSDTLRVSKLSKKYFICEFFKRFFIILLFFITSGFTIYYIYKNFEEKHVCGNLDLYNYKYENEVRFIPNISNNKYFVFTGKFPFDVLTYKLRKDALKNSMNNEIKKYNDINQREIYGQIEDLSDHKIQIMSFIKQNNKMKCEKKILDLYSPFYLKTTDAVIKNYDYVINEINYSYISNPYIIQEKKLYMELSNFMKKNEKKNKICFITSYLRSLKEDDTSYYRVLADQNHTIVVPNKEKPNEISDKNVPIPDENSSKRFFKNDNSNVEQKNPTQEPSLNNSRNTNNTNNTIAQKKKIIFLYDSIDNNLVDLIIAIYNMQYGNSYNNLKEYWEEIKKKFKIIHPEEIYLFEW